MAKMDPKKMFYAAITLIILYNVLSLFLSGGFGIDHEGELTGTLEFEFGNAIDMNSIIQTILFAVVAIIVGTILLNVTNISSRNQFFAIVLAGVGLYLLYKYLFGPGAPFQIFDGPIFQSMASAIVGP